MNERMKELLFETIQLLRNEIRTQFSDWKDADDWLFSQLNLTKSEASEIFDGRAELVYLGSTKDENEPDKDLYEGDITFETRGDAEAVLEQMDDVIDRYGIVTVADMYDMADLTAPYTSNKYGWTSINSAEVVRVRDGYILKLPKATDLKL